MPVNTREVEDAPDVALLKKMAHTWPKRATVRADLYKYAAEYTDEERPDYPVEFIPFAQHPRYEATSQETKRRVETWAWLVYNDRTIQAEELLANPAMTLIMHGAFEGAESSELRQAVQQCLIDEHFHTLMHMTAMVETRRFRKLEEDFVYPHTLMGRRLVAARERVSDPWERKCLQLVFGTVAEVSIKAFLNLMAENKAIQPVHSTIALVHNRDESAHGQILVPVMKILWRRMNESQRRFVIKELPNALEAFTVHDFTAWRRILEHEKVEGTEEIIADCERLAHQKKKMVLDVSGMRKLAVELEILDQVDFEFDPDATATS